MNLAFYIVTTVFLITQIVLDYRLRHIDRDARTTRNKNLRVFLLYFTLCGVIVALIFNLQKEVASQKAGANLNLGINRVTSNQLVLDSSVSNGFQILTTVLATNRDPATRLAVREGEVVKATQRRDEASKRRELVPIDVVDLRALRAERESKRAEQAAQRELQIKQEELQRERAEIAADEAARLKEIQDKQVKEENSKAISQKEKLLADQCLSIFDCVIRRFYVMLDSLAKDTGERPYSDFPNGVPTVYESGFVDQGRITNATHTIRLGTNSAWNFMIATRLQRPLRDPNVIPIAAIPTLKIVCQGREGEQTLLIRPGGFRGRGDVRYGFSEIDRVFINLAIPGQPSIERQEYLTNYTKVVDEALRTLIEEQDAQFPLTVTSK